MCFILHTLPPLDQWNSEGFPEFPRADSSQREPTVLEARDSFFLDLEPRLRRPGQKLFCFGCGWWYDREIVLLPPLQRVVYVNTDERDYERDYQAALPQGRTAADGFKPRHSRGDMKRERSFSGLRGFRKQVLTIERKNYTKEGKTKSAIPLTSRTQNGPRRQNGAMQLSVVDMGFIG